VLDVLKPVVDLVGCVREFNALLTDATPAAACAIEIYAGEGDHVIDVCRADFCNSPLSI
jgi:hypothetical protein